MECIVAVPHTQDPVGLLPEDLPRLIVLAPKYKADRTASVRESKTVFDEKSGAAALLRCTCGLRATETSGVRAPALEP